MKSGSKGFRPGGSDKTPAPSRAQILQFIIDANHLISLEQLADQFELNQNQIEAVHARLERMRKGGLLIENRAHLFGLPEKMDMVKGKISGHPDGYGFVIPDDGSDDLYLHYKQMRKVLHGDNVLARVRRTDHRGRKEGAIIEVLGGAEHEIVGHFHIRDGVGFVEPDNSRYARDITIPKAKFNDAKIGDVVLVRITGHPVENRHTVGEIIEVLGQAITPGMETEIAIRKHEIPNSWPEQISDELKSLDLKIKEHKSRKDIRHLPLVTIDGADAKDFDDAVYCSPLNSGWRLIVAIADVSHYVKVGTALDTEAFNRGNSVYFPNRVVPMLPEVLSNGICSINPDEYRNCMVCDMEIDQSGSVTQFEFYPGLMKSQARLTYEQVNSMIIEDGQKLRQAWKHVVNNIDQLYLLSLTLRSKRESRGAIDFSFPEPLIEFDQHEKISRISVRERNEAHRLIEECMLVANICAAEYLREHRPDGAIYRNHYGPEAESLRDLRNFLSVLGLKLGGGDMPQASDYSTLLKKVLEKDNQLDESQNKQKNNEHKNSKGKNKNKNVGRIFPVVQSVLLRSLSRAVYGTDQAGHFALAYPVYTHFTSPIRRYSDLVVHRQIKSILGLQDKSLATAKGLSISQVADQCTMTERRADDATWDVIAWLKAEFMLDKIGDEYEGIISSVKDFGVFVQLNDFFVDGLVHVTALGTDYYHYDAERLHLIGKKSGEKFRLGDAIRIRVVRVNMDEAKIDFELAALPDISRPKKHRYRAGKKT